jgi:hypothetical protein
MPIENTRPLEIKFHAEIDQLSSIFKFVGFDHTLFIYMLLYIARAPQNLLFPLRSRPFLFLFFSFR